MSPTVAGCRGPVADAADLVRRAQGWAAGVGGEVQLFEASLVCGPEHLLAAAEKAERALREGTAVAGGRGLETLLYAAGARQIAAALERLGVRDGAAAVAVLAWGAEAGDAIAALGLARDDSVLDPSEAKLRRFGFTDAELATVPEARRADLVLERVALVDVLKR